MDLPDTAPETLNRIEALRGMRFAIWEASLTTVFVVLTYGGVFLTGFALMLGATNQQIGFLAGIGALAGLTQIACPFFAARSRSRKKLVLSFAASGRLLWIFILLIPFFHLDKPIAVWLLIILFAISVGLFSFPTPAWTTWMGDLVPESSRGRYFGRRSMVAGVVSMACLLLSGVYKDNVSHNSNLHTQTLSFSIIFAVGVLFAILGLINLYFQAEPPRQTEAPPPLASFIRLPFQQPNFRRLTIFTFWWTIALTIPAPYFAVYMIKYLHMSYGQMNFLAVMGTLGGLCSVPTWGYLIDKFGNRPILLVCASIGSFLCLPWLLTTPQNCIPVLIFVNLVSGIIWNGFALAQFNLGLVISPQKQKQSYLAALFGVAAIGNFAGPLLGAGVLQILSPINPASIGLNNRIEVLFILSACARVLSSLLTLRSIQEPASQTASHMLQQIASTDPVRTALYLRGVKQVTNEVKRAESIQKLGSIGASMVVDDLIPGLEDTSLSVRRETARALGRIRDKQAVDALGNALNNPALEISELAARALGRIASEDAIPYLLAALQSSHHRPTQAAVIRALGNIGSADTVGPISSVLQQAHSVDHPEIAEAACEALAAIGSPSAIPALSSALLDLSPSVRSIAARSLAQLGPGDTADFITQALSREQEENNLGAISEALSQVGGSERIPALHIALARASTPVVRKQIAHAIATLLAPPSEAYAVMATSVVDRPVQIEKFARQYFTPGSGDATGKADSRELIELLHQQDYPGVIDWSLRSINDTADENARKFLGSLAATQTPTSEEEAILSVLAAAGALSGSPNVPAHPPRMDNLLDDETLHDFN